MKKLLDKINRALRYKQRSFYLIKGDEETKLTRDDLELIRDSLQNSDKLIKKAESQTTSYMYDWMTDKW